MPNYIVSSNSARSRASRFSASKTTMRDVECSSSSSKREDDSPVVVPVPTMEDFHFDRTSTCDTVSAQVKEKKIRIIKTNDEKISSKKKATTTKKTKGRAPPKDSPIRRSMPKTKPNKLKTNLNFKKSDTLQSRRCDAADEGRGGGVPPQDGSHRPEPKTTPTRAVAIDTRCQETFESDAITRSYLLECRSFLQRASRIYGVKSMLCSSSSCCDGSQTVRIDDPNLNWCHSKPEDKTKWNKLLSPTSTCTTPTNSRTLESWTHFVSLVETIAKELSTNGPPLDVTILTNDVIFWGDDEKDDWQREGLSKFWTQTVENNALDGKISSISILVLEFRNNLPSHYDSCSLLGLRGCVEDADDLHSDIGKTTSRYPSRLKSSEAVHAILKHISFLQQTTTTTTTTHRTTSLTLDARLIPYPHRISVGAVFRGWMRQSLPSVRISFPLPEILGGASRCSVSLTLEPVLAPRWNCCGGLWWGDIESLEGCVWEIVQIVPTGSVDGSLLHGVPLVARPASAVVDDCEYDWEAHQEMRCLVRQLWRYLDEKDCGLLLRVTHRNYVAGNSTNYHFRPGDESYFLLVTERAPDVITGGGNRSGDAGDEECLYYTGPMDAIMYRYGTGDEIVRDLSDACHNGSINRTIKGSEEQDTAEQYYDYIAQSLDLIECKGVNVMLLGSRLPSIDNQESRYGNGTKQQNEPYPQGKGESDADTLTDNSNGWETSESQHQSGSNDVGYFFEGVDLAAFDDDDFT